MVGFCPQKKNWCFDQPRPAREVKFLPGRALPSRRSMEPMEVMPGSSGDGSTAYMCLDSLHTAKERKSAPTHLPRLFLVALMILILRRVNITLFQDIHWSDSKGLCTGFQDDSNSWRRVSPAMYRPPFQKNSRPQKPIGNFWDHSKKPGKKRRKTENHFFPGLTHGFPGFFLDREPFGLPFRGRCSSHRGSSTWPPVVCPAELSATGASSGCPPCCRRPWHVAVAKGGGMDEGFSMFFQNKGEYRITSYFWPPS